MIEQEVRQVRDDLSELKAWRARVESGLRRLEVDIELDDDSLRAKQAALQQRADKLAGAVTDEQVEAAFAIVEQREKRERDEWPPAKERARKILGMIAAIECERPLRDTERAEFDRKLSLIRMAYEGERSAAAVAEGGVAQIRRCRGDEGSEQLDVTDAEVEAELRGERPVVSEHRQRQVRLEGLRRRARESVREMKKLRAEGRATEQDEIDHATNMSTLAKLIEWSEEGMKQVASAPRGAERSIP